MLAAGAAVMGGGLLAVAPASSLVAAVPGLLAVAAGFGVLTTLGFAVYSAAIPPGEEGTFSALYFAVRSVASAVALPVAGWTIDVSGSYRALFVLGAVPTLAALVPLGHAARPPWRRWGRRALPYLLLVAATALALAGGVFVQRTELLLADEAVFRALAGLGETPQVVDALLVDPHIRNYALIALLTGAVAWRRRSEPRRAVADVVLAGLLAYAAVRACWLVWERPRPEELLGTTPANGHAWADYPSFPSGHVAVTTALAVAAGVRVPPLRWWLAGFAAIIAVTRVTYGAHFPSDVLAGLVLGALAGAVAVDPAGVRAAVARRWRRPSPVALRRVARVWSAAAIGGYALLAWTLGPPAAPAGGLLDDALQHDLQLALLAVSAACVAVAWRRDVAGALLVVLAAALGIFAAVQYTPGFAALAVAALGVPGVLFLVAWARGRRPAALGLVGAFALGVLAAGAAGAVAAYDAVYGPAHPQSTTAAAPSGPVRWAWAGAVTTDGFAVTVRLQAAGQVRLRVAERGEALDRPVRTSRAVAVSDATDGLATLQVRGLRPDAAYDYGIEVDGRLVDGREGTVRTFPAGPASFTLAVGACARTGSNGAVFDATRARDPLMFLVTGDLFYGNVDDDAPTRILDQYDRALSPPAPAALYRHAPIAYTWDDHDFGGDGASSTTRSRPAATAVYRQAVPHYPLPAGTDGAIYQAFDVGAVRVLMLDTRADRIEGRTMLGAAQNAWLRRELLRARDHAKLTILVSSVPWIADAEPGADHWGGYADERRALSRFVADHGIRNLLMLAGDAHMVALDDGSHTDYSGTGRAGFPLLHAGALDRPGHAKGGPYSGGAFPGAGQYGTVRVEDQGDRLAVTLEGWRYDGRRLVAHRFTTEPVGR